MAQSIQPSAHPPRPLCLCGEPPPALYNLELITNDVPNLSYISPKAEVRESPIHGRGLFAREPFARGEVVCVKGGHVFDRAALKAMPDWYRSAEIQVAEDLFIGPLFEDER